MGKRVKSGKKKKKTAGKIQEPAIESNPVASVAEQILEAAQILEEVVEEAPQAKAPKDKLGENPSPSNRSGDENQEKEKAKVDEVVDEVLKDLQQNDDAVEGEDYQTPPTSVDLQQDAAADSDSDRTLSTVREQEEEKQSEDERSHEKELESVKDHEDDAGSGKEDDVIPEKENKDEAMADDEQPQRQEPKGKKLHNRDEGEDEEKEEPERKKKKMKQRRFLDSATKEKFDSMTKIGLIHESTVLMSEHRFAGILDFLKKARMEKTVTYAKAIIEVLIKEFYAHLHEDLLNQDSPKAYKVYVRGVEVEFSPAVINIFFDRDGLEEEEEIDGDRVISKITGRKVKS